jgi:hypothetical protein
MRTIKSTGPLLYAVHTSATSGIPKGKVHIHLVRYETLEMDEEAFKECNFKVHDANQPEPKRIAELVAL